MNCQKILELVKKGAKLPVTWFLIETPEITLSKHHKKVLKPSRTTGNVRICQKSKESYTETSSEFPEVSEIPRNAGNYYLKNILEVVSTDSSVSEIYF